MAGGRGEKCSNSQIKIALEGGCVVGERGAVRGVWAGAGCDGQKLKWTTNGKLCAESVINRQRQENRAGTGGGARLAGECARMAAHFCWALELQLQRRGDGGGDSVALKHAILHLRVLVENDVDGKWSEKKGQAAAWRATDLESGGPTHKDKQHCVSPKRGQPVCKRQKHTRVEMMVWFLRTCGVVFSLCVCRAWLCHSRRTCETKRGRAVFRVIHAARMRWNMCLWAEDMARAGGCGRSDHVANADNIVRVKT